MKPTNANEAEISEVLELSGVKCPEFYDEMVEALARLHEREILADYDLLQEEANTEGRWGAFSLLNPHD